LKRDLTSVIVCEPCLCVTGHIGLIQMMQALSLATVRLIKL